MALTRRGKAVVTLIVLGSLIGLPLGGGYLYLRSVGVYGSSDPGRVVEVRIPKGAGTGTIGQILEDAGVITSATGFRLATYFDGGIEDVQAGQYELPTGLTARDALKALTEEGPLGEEFVTVTFPEGAWLEDFAATLGNKTHLSESRFLKLVEDGGVTSDLLPDGVTTLEGLLFPSTYQIIEKDTERGVAQRLVREMEEQLAEIGFEDKAEALGVSPYEALIVASMIEAEAAIDADRDKISRVIYNRIERGIALGIDATVIYALGEHTQELTQSDLEIDSPYNTRKFAGMPPTPIGAPGRESLEAAVQPANGGWVYYVLSDCEGHHAFSVDYNDFLNDKNAYQSLQC